MVIHSIVNKNNQFDFSLVPNGVSEIPFQFYNVHSKKYNNRIRGMTSDIRRVGVELVAPTFFSTPVNVCSVLLICAIE